jgi:WD40 repeat protein
MRFLTAHMRVVDQVAFSGDGRRLFAAGSNVPALRYTAGNRGIDVWDLPGGPSPAGRWLTDQLIVGLAVNASAPWLYVGTGYKYPDESASAYFAVDLASGRPFPLGLRAGNTFALAPHRSGEWFVVFGYGRDWRNGRLVRWRQPPAAAPVREWECQPRKPHHFTRYLACDPAGTRLVTHELEGGVAVNLQVYELVVRDAGSGEVRETVPVPGRTVDQLLFSPDGTWLVVRAGPSLLVWDGRDLGRKPRKVRGASKGHFTGLAFHPGGRYLAATSNDRTVRLYDTATWQPAHSYAWDAGRMRSVAFSPDGCLAAAGSDTGQVVVWDIDR